MKYSVFVKETIWPKGHPQASAWRARCVARHEDFQAAIEIAKERAEEAALRAEKNLGEPTPQFNWARIMNEDTGHECLGQGCARFETCAPGHTVGLCRGPKLHRKPTDADPTLHATSGGGGGIFG